MSEPIAAFIISKAKDGEFWVDAMKEFNEVELSMTVDRVEIHEYGEKLPTRVDTGKRPVTWYIRSECEHWHKISGDGAAATIAKAMELFGIRMDQPTAMTWDRGDIHLFGKPVKVAEMDDLSQTIRDVMNGKPVTLTFEPREA